MADYWQEYVDDPRTICNYGSKCYQKNPEHHKTFKHPPVKGKEADRNKRRFKPYAKNKESDSPTTDSKKVDEPKTPSNSSKPSASDDNEYNKNIVIQLPEELTFFDNNTDKSILKELFLVEMPDDFYSFYEFMNNCGKSAVEALASVNLELIGPYDFLLGKLPILEDKQLYLIHWRFFYDPPEFQAVLKKKNSEYHIGYFRDTPEQKSAFLASNDSAKGYYINLMSENIFGAVYLYLENEKKTSPFTAVTCQKLMAKIKTYAEENNISLEKFTMSKRLPQIVTKSFHGAGVAVPYDKKTELGYRRLSETDASLKKIFKNLQAAESKEERGRILSDMQSLITNASIAVDECDFGTALELGIDLFCSGLKDLQLIALNNLKTAYSVLNRKPFAQIAEAHLTCRRKGPNMSLLSSQKQS